MWYFRDYTGSNFECLFSTEEKAEKFVKAFGIRFYDENHYFPSCGGDYVLAKMEIDPNLKQALAKMFNV